MANTATPFFRHDSVDVLDDVKGKLAQIGVHLGCDHITEGADTCCDAPQAYAVWWTPVRESDLDTKPVSVVCERHALAVNLRLVDRMQTAMPS